MDSDLRLRLLNKLELAFKDHLDFPKPGIVFKDITPLFLDSVLCNELLDHLADLIKSLNIDAIAGLESRGFLFGATLAMKLGLPFIIIRKAGKLPGKVLQKAYGLEYGTSVIEIQEGIVKAGWNVLIHDDLLATGGTAAAAAELLKEAGGNVAGFLFLIELKKLGGADILKKYNDIVKSVMIYE